MFEFSLKREVPKKVCDICGKTRKVTDMYLFGHKAICRIHTLKARAKNHKLR